MKPLKKDPDELAELVHNFVAAFAGVERVPMLKVLAVAVPLMNYLDTMKPVSDAAILALSNDYRKMALLSMALAAVAKANPEVARRYEDLFAFLK